MEQGPTHLPEYASSDPIVLPEVGVSGSRPWATPHPRLLLLPPQPQLRKATGTPQSEGTEPSCWLLSCVLSRPLSWVPIPAQPGAALPGPRAGEGVVDPHPLSSLAGQALLPLPQSWRVPAPRLGAVRAWAPGKREESAEPLSPLKDPQEAPPMITRLEQRVPASFFTRHQIKSTDLSSDGGDGDRAGSPPTRSSEPGTPSLAVASPQTV